MKDYYAILGVVPSAEDVVIRAAWKALSQRYHPDRHTGDATKSNAKMAEVNEAYSILSDPIQRKKYDDSRGDKKRDFGDWVNEEDAGQDENNFDPLEKAWGVAVSYFADLAEINRRLSRISQLLAFTYRASLLEYKSFDNRVELAQLAEKNFLEAYFGKNPQILDFARKLIFEGNKLAAKALNDAVRVLGSNVSSDIIFTKICQDFNVETDEMVRQRYSMRERYAEEVKRNAEEARIRLLELRTKIATENSMEAASHIAERKKQDFFEECAKVSLDELIACLDSEPLFVAVRDADGNTPLHLAIKIKNENLIRELIARGANPEVHNNADETPIDLAKTQGMNAIADLLAINTEYEEFYEGGRTISRRRKKSF